MAGMRSGWRKALAGLSAAVAVLSGSWLIATHTATYRSADRCAIPASPPVDSPSLRDANQRVEVVTEKLAGLSTRDEAYEGVAVAPPTLIICIYRTSAASAVAERDYRALVPADIQLQFEPALISARQEARLQALIEARQQWLTHHGVQVAGYGPNGQGGPFLIWYAERVRPSVALLRPFQTFGPGTVVFRHAVPATWA